MEEELKIRQRNAAHSWTDKKIITFFRKYFSRKHYKNFSSIYHALCMIDSDFSEGRLIKNFTKTVATYAGMDIETIRIYLRAMQKINLIDYYQTLQMPNKFGSTKLIMYAWNDTNPEEKIHLINSVLMNKENLRRRENTGTGNPSDGKTKSNNNTPNGVPLFNNTTNVVLNTYRGNTNKNPSTEIECDNLPTKKETTHPAFKIQNTCPPDLPSDNPSYNQAEYLRTIIQVKRNVNILPTKVKKWAQDIDLLNRVDGISYERIQTVLTWYESNIGGQYIPIIESGSALRTKFLNLESAMERNKFNGKPNSTGSFAIKNLKDSSDRFRNIQSRKL